MILLASREENYYPKGMITLLALLAAVGLSHLIVDGSILAKLRGYLVDRYKDSRPWVLELISCYQCTGFWTGALMGLLLQPISWGVPWYLSFPLHLFVTPLIFACASSFASMIGAGLLNYLDAPAMMAAAMKKKQKDEQPQT